MLAALAGLCALLTGGAAAALAGLGATRLVLGACLQLLASLAPGMHAWWVGWRFPLGAWGACWEWNVNFAWMQVPWRRCLALDMHAAVLEACMAGLVPLSILAQWQC
jgi:hypothetical protein